MSVEIQIRNNRIFGIALLVIEAILIFIYGFFIHYKKDSTNETAQLVIHDDWFIIATMILLALCGFGLITTYIKPVSIATLTHLIIILGFSIQLYFPLRGMWIKMHLAGASVDTKYLEMPISVSNVENSLYLKEVDKIIHSSPLTQYIACFISLIVGYSGLIGRVGNLEVLFYTIIGTLIYEFNSLIFWRIVVTDCGYGMRIFLFGGCMGIVSSFILNKKETTVAHRRYMSDQYYQAINLIGAIFIWCLLPVLNFADLWNNADTSTTKDINNQRYILPIALINMLFALCGGVIGVTCVCLALYKKLNAHVFVFSVFAGGIGYSSISNLYYEPGLAMSMGTITGVFSALLIAKIKAKVNEKGIIDSNGIIGSYLIPGFVAGILSAIFHAVAPKDYGGYITPYPIPNLKQGGIQFAGVVIALILGTFSGLVSGFIMRKFNQREADDQFSADFIANEIAVKDIRQNATD